MEPLLEVRTNRNQKVAAGSTNQQRNGQLWEGLGKKTQQERASETKAAVIIIILKTVACFIVISIENNYIPLFLPFVYGLRFWLLSDPD